MSCFNNILQDFYQDLETIQIIHNNNLPVFDKIFTRFLQKSSVFRKEKNLTKILRHTSFKKILQDFYIKTLLRKEEILLSSYKTCIKFINPLK